MGRGRGRGGKLGERRVERIARGRHSNRNAGCRRRGGERRGSRCRRKEENPDRQRQTWRRKP
eukprot:762812-Hanusia_phi.AAC.9